MELTQTVECSPPAALFWSERRDDAQRMDDSDDAHDDLHYVIDPWSEGEGIVGLIVWSSQLWGRGLRIVQSRI